MSRFNPGNLQANTAMSAPASAATSAGSAGMAAAGGALPWVGAVAGLGQLGLGVAGAFADDDPGIYHLPREVEIQMMNTIQDRLAQSEAENKRLMDVRKALDERMSLFDRTIKGQMAPAALQKELARTSAQIARAFGGDAMEAARRGFLTADETRDLDNLRQIESQDFRDPVLEGELADKRSAFEQELARSGVGPAGRLRALKDFDRTATEMRFTRAEELRTNRAGLVTNRLRTASDLRTAGQGRALAGFSAVQSELNRNKDLSTLLMQGSQAQAGVEQSIAAIRSQNLSDEMGMFQFMGQTDFSTNARRAIESGLIGPGSIYDQTGIAGGKPMEMFSQRRRASEEAISRSAVEMASTRGGGRQENRTAGAFGSSTYNAGASPSRTISNLDQLVRPRVRFRR